MRRLHMRYTTYGHTNVQSRENIKPLQQEEVGAHDVHKILQSSK